MWRDMFSVVSDEVCVGRYFVHICKWFRMPKDDDSEFVLLRNPLFHRWKLTDVIGMASRVLSVTAVVR